MKKTLLVCLLLVGTVFAQEAPTSSGLTATITDSDGTAWAGGTYKVSFATVTGYSGPYMNNGATINIATIYSGSLNSSGAFTQSLADSLVTTPAGSGWTFTICPAATPANCFTKTLLTVTGTSYNASAPLSAAAISPRLSPTQMPVAYNTTELLAGFGNGSFYYDYTNGAQLYSGGVWGSFGGGGGSGTVNSGTIHQFGYYAATGTAISALGADLTFGGTAHTLLGALA